MGIAAMKKPTLIKVPIKQERVKRPRLFPLLISKPWLILELVTIRLDTLLFACSMLAQLHSFLCIFDSDCFGTGLILGLLRFSCTRIASAHLFALTKKTARSLNNIYASTIGQKQRATGVTVYLENGGRLEHAQRMAAHESPRTTKLYDRTKDEITIGEVERIQL